jgi:hypothetical protein
MDDLRGMGHLQEFDKPPWQSYACSDLEIIVLSYRTTIENQMSVSSVLISEVVPRDGRAPLNEQLLTDVAGTCK